MAWTKRAVNVFLLDFHKISPFTFLFLILYSASTFVKWSVLCMIALTFLGMSFSIHTPLFILFSLFCLMLFCCLALIGCSAKSNSPSYSSPHAISNHSGCAASSFFSSWICGEDRHLSEVCWSASSSFLSSAASVYIRFLVLQHWIQLDGSTLLRGKDPF